MIELLWECFAFFDYCLFWSIKVLFKAKKCLLHKATKLNKSFITFDRIYSPPLSVFIWVVSLKIVKMILKKLFIAVQSRISLLTSVQSEQLRCRQTHLIYKNFQIEFDTCFLFTIELSLTYIPSFSQSYEHRMFHFWPFKADLNNQYGIF